MVWKHSQPELRDKAHFPGGRALLHITPFLSYSYKMMICWPSQCPGISRWPPCPAAHTEPSDSLSSREEAVDRWPGDEGGRGHSGRGSSLCKGQGPLTDSEQRFLQLGCPLQSPGGRRTVPTLTLDPQINEQGLWGQDADI